MFNILPATDELRPSPAASVPAARSFLTAEWRDVVMLNYEVDPALLAPFVPAGTELDPWQEKHFVSLVGFRFLNTTVVGVPIPFHRNFDEINLRFYVRRREGNDARRGVVFIREIVPRRAVAVVARTLYNEPYVRRPMSHRIEPVGAGRELRYAWTGARDQGQLCAMTRGEPMLPAEGSEEQFIAEHYWGYSAQRDDGCLEYRVEHAPWRVWRACEASFAGEVGALYGAGIAKVLGSTPASAFVAEGSAVTVFRGLRLRNR